MSIKISREGNQVFRKSDFAKKIKIAACGMALLMLFVVLFSSFYIAVEADHECEDEHCSVCVCIEQCRTTLHQLSGCGMTVLICAAVCILLLKTIRFLQVKFRTETPVSLKIRLNN